MFERVKKELRNNSFKRNTDENMSTKAANFTPISSRSLPGQVERNENSVVAKRPKAIIRQPYSSVRPLKASKLNSSRKFFLIL